MHDGIGDGGSRESARLQERPQVMVVDDDPSMRTSLEAFLSARGFSALALDDAEDAVHRYGEERPAAVILDAVMPGHMDGLAALAAFKKIDRDVPIIMISAECRATVVVQAMKLGASAFVSKPFDDEDLEALLASALMQHQLSSEGAALREQLEPESTPAMLFGQSERMAAARRLIDRVADTDAAVLIRGESGTGKELVARVIHASSLRRNNPFVKVHCAALSTELLESELLGYERGAFTDALNPKPVKFEQANHGTMFLDEIAEMSPALQARLLELLRDEKSSRLGGTRDVRVVGATNREIDKMVADGQFREDLFLRLNVVVISLPPLRERREEIPVLIDYFFKKYSVQYHRMQAKLSQDTMHLFMEYDWPGNVRELENLIKRVMVLGEEAAIRTDVMPRQPGVASVRVNGHGAIAIAPAAAPALAPPETAMDRTGAYSLKEISRTIARKAERVLILKTLEQTRWNRTETAKTLCISYKALLYKIKEFGLDKAS